MPSGRVVRTMRMRPGKPLPPLPAETKNVKALEKEMGKKKKAKVPDTRARSRTIDVTKWNGSYITGVFLGENEVAQAVNSRQVVNSLMSVEKEKKKEKPVIIEDTKVDPPVPKIVPTSSSVFAPPVPPSSNPIDLLHERDQTISFLNSFLFSSKADTAPVDWDSDVDLDEANVVEARNAHDADESYEVVPRNQHDEENVDADMEPSVDEGVENSDSDSEADVEMETEENSATTVNKPPPPKNALKDLFAPREDEGIPLFLLIHQTYI